MYEDVAYKFSSKSDHKQRFSNLNEGVHWDDDLGRGVGGFQEQPTFIFHQKAKKVGKSPIIKHQAWLRAFEETKQKSPTKQAKKRVPKHNANIVIPRNTRYSIETP